MKNTNKQIDEYIERAEMFARPILEHIRKLIHEVVPDVEETIKWGFPHFEYKEVLCSMAAFKHHCAFGFWKDSLIPGIQEIRKDKGDARGSLGRITQLSDLPKDSVIKKLIGEAVTLNEKGVTLEKKTKDKKLVIPDYFLKAVKANKKALKTFENFNYSNKKEYVEWVVEAKTDKTRDERLKTSVQWLSEGKTRLWKYMKR